MALGKASSKVTGVPSEDTEVELDEIELDERE